MVLYKREYYVGVVYAPPEIKLLVKTLNPAEGRKDPVELWSGY